MKLNLGCGLHKLEGYINVDEQDYLEPDVKADLTQRWPFDDNSVDEAVASHILEHLTTDQLFAFMRELYRVCKNGAAVHIAVPHPRSDLYLNDPTHQRPVMPGTMILFSKGQLEQMAKDGCVLTPFWKIIGVDFHFDTRVTYNFNEPFNQLPPEEALAAEKHVPNAVAEIKMRITAVK